MSQLFSCSSTITFNYVSLRDTILAKIGLDIAISAILSGIIYPVWSDSISSFGIPFSPRLANVIATAGAIFSRQSVKCEFHIERTDKHITLILKAIVLLLFVSMILFGHRHWFDRPIYRYKIIDRSTNCVMSCSQIFHFAPYFFFFCFFRRT